MRGRLFRCAARGAPALCVLALLGAPVAAWAGPFGRVDAVFANWGVKNRVCLNDGAGGFTCSDVSTNADATQRVALGDLDGVNGPDAVFANRFVENRVCLNDGAGGFTCSDVSTDTNDSLGLALGDVDGDGDLDAVFVNNAVPNRVCLNDGSGSFTSCSNVSADTNVTQAVALGDVDGDNDQDIVFGNSWAAPERLCKNDGLSPPTFTCTDIYTLLTTVWDVALGDVDGDNDLDAVFAVTSNAQENLVCLNNGSGSFTCSVVSSDLNQTWGVALGDVDGDNDLDAVFANSNQRNRVCQNDGSGSFTCGDVSAETNDSSDVAVGNVDGRNGPDAVFSNSFPAANRVCLNDGAGGFNCSDTPELVTGKGVALGDLDGPGPVPALSLRGALLAFLLLVLGGAVAGLLHRQRRRVASA